MPNESVRAVDQSEDTEVVTALTAVCREADRTFERVGGGSRHWVRDCFLPLLNRAGWALLRAEAAPGPLVARLLAHIEAQDTELAALRAERDDRHMRLVRVAAEREQAMRLLNPTAPQETLLGAIRNLQQAHISERDNAEAAEAELAQARAHLAQCRKLAEKWVVRARQHEQDAADFEAAGDVENFHRQDAYTYAGRLHAEQLDAALALPVSASKETP